MTWFLKKFGYWSSYNIPYLTKISEVSGYALAAKQNSWWRWGFSPRAKIFERDQHKVINMNTLRTLMRYFLLSDYFILFLDIMTINMTNLAAVNAIHHIQLKLAFLQGLKFASMSKLYVYL